MGNTISSEELQVRVAAGNKGAARVVGELARNAKRIDPRHAANGSTAIRELEALGVIGDRVWMLYKDVCDEDIFVVLAVLRAHDMRLLGAKAIAHAIDNRGAGIDNSAIVMSVLGQAPEFGQCSI